MFVSCKLRDFWYEVQKKKTKKYARKNALPDWNDVAVWKDSRPPYIPEDTWAEYIQHVMSEGFTRRSQSDAGSLSLQIHSSVTTHTGGSVSFHFACEVDGKINFNNIYL